MVGRCTKRRRPKKLVTEAPDATSQQHTVTPNAAGGQLHGRDDPSTMLHLAAETPVLFNSWSPPPGCDLHIVTTADGLTVDHNLSSHDLSFASGSGFEEFAAMISYSPRSQHALGTGCVMDLPQSTTSSSASVGDATRLASLSQTCQIGYEELHTMLSRSVSRTANNNNNNDDDNNNNAADVLRMCFASITALELQFEEETRPIDELMQAGKACARELRAVIELESFNQCSSCPMLIATALDLLISLYESIFNRLACGRANGGDAYAPPAQSGNGKGASLRLGSFQADPEDAADVWIHLMLAELRRLSRLVDTVSSLRSDAATPEENAPRAMAAPRGLCNNLHRRINTIVSSIQDRL
ncbi:hypothetical protein BDV11DRAFT_168022 [Aspergillus similis]